MVEGVQQGPVLVGTFFTSAGEGLCPDGCEDEVDDNEYRPGQTPMIFAAVFSQNSK